MSTVEVFGGISNKRSELGAKGLSGFIVPGVSFMMALGNNWE
jgi:precorrin-4 methylase